MAALVHVLALVALTAGEPGFEIHLHHAPSPAPSRAPSASARARDRAPLPVAYADAVPRPPSPPSRVGEPGQPGVITPPPPARKLGTNTTVFVNFDGVTIGECNPSNSHANCHWLESNTTFDPWSGSLTERVAILDAMRAIAQDYGIRITGQRPPSDEPYVMVVYGGDSIAEEALGRAPAGDCWDDLPNQIAYVYLDGERATWINGGASTAMHEASHTWGFDHVGLDGVMMAPTGGNTIANPFDGCAQIVENLEYDPGEGSCPEINLDLCGLEDFQHADATLKLLFGQPYVDDRPPILELIAPFDGIYYEGPASFDVILAVTDDLHPQIYEMAIAVPGLIDDPSFSPVIDPSFEVEGLPLGHWTFELRLRDAAGNEGSLQFDVTVGDDTLPLDDGCVCSTAARSDGEGAPWAALTLLGIGFGRGLRRRKRPSPAPLARFRLRGRPPGR